MHYKEISVDGQLYICCKENSVDDLHNVMYRKENYMDYLHNFIMYCKENSVDDYKQLYLLQRKLCGCMIYTTLCFAKKFCGRFTHNFIYCKENSVDNLHTTLCVAKKMSVDNLHITSSIAKRIMWMIYTQLQRKFLDNLHTTVSTAKKLLWIIYTQLYALQRKLCG